MLIWIASTCRGNSNEYPQQLWFYKENQKNIAQASSNTPFMQSSADIAVKCALIR